MGDARLLLLPVRSLTSHFKWATCPALLRRFQQDARRLDLAVGDFHVPEVAADTVVLPKVEKNPTAVFLEEFRLKPVPEAMDSLIEALALLIADPEAVELLVRQLAVVEDDLFSPGDWHQPKPVPFLVVDTATFLFGIAPRSSQSSGEVDFAFEALEDSLRLLGAGAKTAVGYGHMGIEVAGLEQLERDLEEAREQQIRTRELEAMSPFERSLEETITNSSGQAPHVALLQALETGAWEGEEALQVALRIGDLMVAENKWRPSSKRPNRDKDHQRTLEVASLLKRTD